MIELNFAQTERKDSYCRTWECIFLFLYSSTDIVNRRHSIAHINFRKAIYRSLSLPQVSDESNDVSIRYLQYLLIVLFVGVFLLAIGFLVRLIWLAHRRGWNTRNCSIRSMSLLRPCSLEIKSNHLLSRTVKLDLSFHQLRLTARSYLSGFLRFDVAHDKEGKNRRVAREEQEGNEYVVWSGDEFNSVVGVYRFSR